MAQRIKLAVARDLDEKYRFFVADVTVHFSDGTSEHYFQERAKGSPIRPYTAREHEAKLDELTEGVIGKAQSDRLFRLINELAPDRPVSEITSLLYPR